MARRHVNLYCEQRRGHVRLAASGWSRDLGLEGMFIETNARTFDAARGIEVHFSLAGLDGVVEHRIPVRVARRNDAGIGVCFLRFDPTLFRDLEVMLRAPDGLSGSSRGTEGI